MSAHTMTPIREEEGETTMSTNDGASIPKVEANVNVHMAANTTTTDGQKGVKTSNLATTIVPVREEKEELGSEMMVVGYFFQVPSVKWHPNLEMMSKAGLTQGQYEHKVLAQGYVDDFACQLRHPQFKHHHNVALSSVRLHDEQLHLFIVLQPYPVHVQ